jgi:hypothetical protein
MSEGPVIINIEMRLLGLRMRERKSTGRIYVAEFELLKESDALLMGYSGERFGAALALIGDDEKMVIKEVKKPRNKIAMLGGYRRNEVPYQIVLQNYFMGKEGYEFVKNTVNPVDRRKMIAAIQHQFCGVTSLAEIQPNTSAAVKFDMLETLYESDKQGLPPPNMDAPNVFQLIGREKR